MAIRCSKEFMANQYYRGIDFWFACGNSHFHSMTGLHPGDQEWGHSALSRILVSRLSATADKKVQAVVLIGPMAGAS
jgi:hypothetical protein